MVKPGENILEFRRISLFFESYEKLWKIRNKKIIKESEFNTEKFKKKILQEEIS